MYLHLQVCLCSTVLLPEKCAFQLQYFVHAIPTEFRLNIHATIYLALLSLWILHRTLYNSRKHYVRNNRLYYRLLSSEVFSRQKYVNQFELIHLSKTSFLDSCDRSFYIVVEVAKPQVQKYYYQVMHSYLYSSESTEVDSAKFTKSITNRITEYAQKWAPWVFYYYIFNHQVTITDALAFLLLHQCTIFYIKLLLS